MKKSNEKFVANPVALKTFSRSGHDLGHSRTLSFNSGQLVPFLSNSEFYPGDTVKVGLNGLIRLNNLQTAVMDSAYLDLYLYFTPHDMVLSRETMSPSLDDSNRSFKSFIGAQDSILNMPLPDPDVSLPCIDFGCIFSGKQSDAPQYLNLLAETDLAEVGFAVNSLADCIAMPTNPSKFTGSGAHKRIINPWDALAYYRIWNDQFRDPNTMNPVTYSILGGAEGSFTWPKDHIVFYHDFFTEESEEGETGHLDCIGRSDSLLPVSAFHGYFGSALPWPLRNLENITVSLGGIAPIYTATEDLVTGQQAALQFRSVNRGLPITGSNSHVVGINSGSQATDSSIGASASASDLVYPSNLYANLNTATAVTVNDLRLAVATQRWYEALARSGNRLSELTFGMFNVVPHNFGDDKPKLLAHRRVRIVNDQVESLSGENLGEIGAFSATRFDYPDFATASFDTWGTVTGLLCVRVQDKFHQGLPRRFTKFKRFDLFWSQFAMLGEQMTKNKEIVFTGSTKDDQGFGYMPAWSELRFWPDEVTGLFRPRFTNPYTGEKYDTLDFWTYVNDFVDENGDDAVPELPFFLNGSRYKDNIDRTLKVKSSKSNFQWFGMIYVDFEAIRPIPFDSIPGLVDHN